MEKESPKRQDRRGCPPGQGTRDAHLLHEGQIKAGRIGNPPFIATDEQRNLVLLYSKVMSHEMIADSLEISTQTLTRHFKSELAQGKREAVAAVGGKLLAKAMAGHPASMIFYLRTQGKWNVRVEHTGEDGGPINLVDMTGALKGYTDEQLALLEPLLAQLITGGGDGEQSGVEFDAESDQG